MRKLLKRGKKNLCLFMAMVMFVSCFSGCGFKKKSPVAETQETAETMGEAATEKEPAGDSKTPLTESAGELKGEDEDSSLATADNATGVETGTKPVKKPAKKQNNKTDSGVNEKTGTYTDVEPDDSQEDETQKAPEDTAGGASDETPGGSQDTTQETTEKKYVVTLYDMDTKLREVEKPAGTVLANIASPYIDGKIFLGWYYDKAFTGKVADTDTLTGDITLYGKYGDEVPIPEGGSSNYLGAQDVASDFAIIVHTSMVATADEVREALILTNITAPSRTDNSRSKDKDELQAEALGSGTFRITAKNGYQAGATYQVEIRKGAGMPAIRYEDPETGEIQSTDVVYFNFTVKREAVLNLSLDRDVYYLAASELSSADAAKILAYTGLYQATTDPATGATVYQPTDATGTFTYDKAVFTAGDVIAVYEGTVPNARDLNTSLEESIAYIKITRADGANYQYKSADAMEVLFTPDVIPVDIDGGDGVTGWTSTGNSFSIENTKLDFVNVDAALKSIYAGMGLTHETVAEPGDFVAFYTGDLAAENVDSKGYGKIESVTATGDSTAITYRMVEEEEVFASMDIYNESELTDKQLDSIDNQQLVAAITNQVLESGFTREAGMYLASMAVETDEVKDLLGENDLEFKDCIITYEDGTPVPTDEMMLMANVLTGGGGGLPEISIDISKGLDHFDSYRGAKGFQVELALKYGFDLRKAGSTNKIHIEMTAIFQTEVMLRFSASGGAVWDTFLFIPYIYDYEMTGNIDQGLYTNIAITATAQLAESEPEGPKLLQPEDTTASDNTNLQQILDLSESIRNMMEECKEAASSDDGEDKEEETGFDGLVEKYNRFIEQASDAWVELVSVPIFATEGTLDPFYITAYSVNIDFVVSATMSVAIGMTFQYEKCQRHSFTLRLFHTGDSTSKTVDLTPERFQFDFYVMGTLGVRAGIRAKVMFGVFSVKLAGIGLQLEAGAYARLWGFFYYCLSWQKGKGKESSATGALYIEIGAYIKLSLALEVLNGIFSYCPTLYENEWPIWSAGDKEHVLSFQYDDAGYWYGYLPGVGYDHYVPVSYDMVREKSIEVPSEVFRMEYLDMKGGFKSNKIFEGNTRANSNASSEKYDDEEKFIVEITKPFSYNPVTNTIEVTPQEGRYSYEGTFTITWREHDLTFNSKPISRTYQVSWIDPDHGYLLNFDTKGGTLIKTKVYDAGVDVEEVDDPVKVGYAFAGWYKDEAYTMKASVPSVMPAENITLYAKWVPVPNEYTVHYWYETLNNGYVCESSVVQKDIYTDNPSKKMRVYTDDILNQDRILADNRQDRYGFEIDYDNTTKQVHVKPDGSSVVNIFYARQIHSVTYTMGDLKDEENPDVVINYRYEEPIYAPYLFMFGYSFEGWDSKIAPTMDIKNLTYNAKWKGNPNTPYYVEHYCKDPQTDSYVMIGGQTGRFYKEGTTGEYVNVKDYVLEDLGYTLEKVTINGEDANPETGRGKIDPKGSLTLRYYYTGDEFTLRFDPGEGVVTSSNVPDKYVHGIPLSIESVNAARTGYRFLGWFEGGEADEAMLTIPADRMGDITLVAKWAENTTLINLQDESTLLGTVTAYYNNILPGLESIPQKAGYVFDGFTDDEGTLYYDSNGIGQLVWQQSRGVNLKAKWVPAKVEISFDVNGGEAELAPIEGTYLGKYPRLPEASRQGYRFLGWTQKGASSDSYITTNTDIRTYNAHTLEAKWAPKDDTPYVVECYLPKDTQDVYHKYTEYTMYGTTDTIATIGKDTYPILGYVFDETAEANVLSADILPDGSTVLKMYYREGNRYQITFDYGDGIPPETQLIAAGGSVELPQTLPEGAEHARDNMQLTGWRLDGVFYSVYSSISDVQSDLTFTAVWEKDTYTIYYRKIDGYNESFVAQKMEFGTPCQVMDNLYTKDFKRDEAGNIIGYYRFAGWNSKIDGSGTRYLPGEDLEPVIDNTNSYGEKQMNLYAMWEEIDAASDVVPYLVTHQINSVDNYPVSYTALHFGKVGEQTEAKAYSFADVTAKDTVIAQKTLTAEGCDDIVINYQRNTYNFKLDYAGGVFEEKTELVLGSLEVGSNIEAKAQQPLQNIRPEKGGYEFVGWDVSLPEYMPNHDILATARYKKTDLYPVDVKCLVEGTDGSYTVKETKRFLAEVGEFTPNLSDYPGYVTPEAIKITVTEQGAECEYRYGRKSYKLTWDAGEGTIDAASDTYTKDYVKYGEAIQAPTLIRAGYTGIWKNLPATMPAQDLTVTPEWTPKKVEYNVLYRYRASAADSDMSNLLSQRFEAPAGSVVQIASDIPENHPEERQKVAEGYLKPLSLTQEIAGDGSTLITYDYELEKHHLYFDFSGGVGDTSTYAQPGDYYIGKQLQIPPLNKVTRQGYTPVGWYDISDPEQKLVEGNMVTMGNRDVTYKLKWKPDTYTISYDLALDNAENPFNPIRYQSGFDFNVSGAFCEHYGFKGWEWNGEGSMPAGVEIMENGLVHITAQATGNLSFKAVWDQKLKQFVGKMYEGASEFYVYNYPEVRNLLIGEVTPPVRDGYVFEYWTRKIPNSKSGYTTSRISDFTPVAYLNINTDYITAKWLPVSEMGDGYYTIHVATETELFDAFEIMKKYPVYRGVTLDQDICINGLSKSLTDIFEEGYVLDGCMHYLKLSYSKVPLFGENYGRIQNLRIFGTVVNEGGAYTGEDTYFGMLAEKNYGEIKNCSTAGSSTVKSDATYLGGLAGYNEGKITDCSIRFFSVSWKAAEGKTIGYVGGYVGYNGINGEIKGCDFEKFVSKSGTGYTGELYMGGIAGRNHGYINRCVVKSYIGEGNVNHFDSALYKDGELYAGGIAGIDAVYDVSKREEQIRGIYHCTVTDSIVCSGYVAGGLMGECHYSSLEGNELVRVNVYADRGYAGQIAGIFDCMRDGYAEYNYITQASVMTNTGEAGVVAGKGHNWNLDSFSKRIHYHLEVRSRDDKTTVTDIGENTQDTYRKGLFYTYIYQNNHWTKYYDAATLVEYQW